MLNKSCFEKLLVTRPERPAIKAMLEAILKLEIADGIKANLIESCVSALLAESDEQTLAELLILLSELAPQFPRAAELVGMELAKCADEGYLFQPEDLALSCYALALYGEKFGGMLPVLLEFQLSVIQELNFMELLIVIAALRRTSLEYSDCSEVIDELHERAVGLIGTHRKPNQSLWMLGEFAYFQKQSLAVASAYIQKMLLCKFEFGRDAALYEVWALLRLGAEAHSYTLRRVETIRDRQVFPKPAAELINGEISLSDEDLLALCKACAESGAGDGSATLSELLSIARLRARTRKANTVIPLAQSTLEVIGERKLAARLFFSGILIDLGQRPKPNRLPASLPTEHVLTLGRLVSKLAINDAAALNYAHRQGMVAARYLHPADLAEFVDCLPGELVSLEPFYPYFANLDVSKLKSARAFDPNLHCRMIQRTRNTEREVSGIGVARALSEATINPDVVSLAMMVVVRSKDAKTIEAATAKLEGNLASLSNEQIERVALAGNLMWRNGAITPARAETFCAAVASQIIDERAATFSFRQKMSLACQLTPYGGIFELVYRELPSFLAKGFLIESAIHTLHVLSLELVTHLDQAALQRRRLGLEQLVQRIADSRTSLSPENVLNVCGSLAQLGIHHNDLFGELRFRIEKGDYTDSAALCAVGYAATLRHPMPTLAEKIVRMTQLPHLLTGDAIHGALTYFAIYDRAAGKRMLERLDAAQIGSIELLQRVAAASIAIRYRPKWLDAAMKRVYVETDAGVYYPRSNHHQAVERALKQAELTFKSERPIRIGIVQLDWTLYVEGHVVGVAFPPPAQFFVDWDTSKELLAHYALAIKLVSRRRALNRVALVRLNEIQDLPDDALRAHMRSLVGKSRPTQFGPLTGRK